MELPNKVVPAQRRRFAPARPGTLSSLVASYMKSVGYVSLRETTKTGYASQLELLRTQHGQRSVSGLTRERIRTDLAALWHRPGAALSVLKMLHVIIRHVMNLDDRNPLKVHHDPSAGIKRPKTREIRAWTNAELAHYEARWLLGTKQRSAYASTL